MSCSTPPISFCVVDDDREARDDLAGLLQYSLVVRLLGAYPDAEEALRHIPHQQPQVVLMDIHLPGMSGFDCVRRLKTACPVTQFLMWTVHEDTDCIFQSLLAGATGYLVKPTPVKDVVAAIQDVHLGGSPMTSQIARQLVQYFQASSQFYHAPEGLTAREQQVLAALAQGWLYKEIAQSLGLSMDTVRNHVRRIYEKLHVHSRTAAVVKYFKNQPAGGAFFPAARPTLVAPKH